MTKTIQLAQSKYTPAKLGKNVYLSEKLDGVPIRVDLRVNPFGEHVSIVSARTRQDEDPLSCHFIITKLIQRVSKFLAERNSTVKQAWANKVITFVGEVTHETYTAFKDTSGVVRTQSPQTGLIYNVFDFNISGDDLPFERRLFVLQQVLPYNTQEVRVIRQFAIDKADVNTRFEEFMQRRPDAEGMIVRDAAGKFEPGKRTWCYQKLLRRPTIDLRVVGFEEATTEASEPKGMVGRVLISYKGEVIGCGPGKLTHAERTALWNDFITRGIGCLETPIATVQYKKDESYAALREPTFQHWRLDKDTPDA
jgi:hypothetical protein